MSAQYTYLPARASLLDYGVVPATPVFFAPAAQSFNRWSAYYGLPRTTLAPAKIGLAGLGAPLPAWMNEEHVAALRLVAQMQRNAAQLDRELRTHIGKETKYVESLGACCAPCAQGQPCACNGVGGLYSDFQDSTSGYGLPVLVGVGIGYLTEKKTGAVVGGLLGAFFRWAWGQAEPTVMPIVEVVTPEGTSGFRDDFRWNPEMGGGDTEMDRAAFRTLQLIFLLGAGTLALKVGKTFLRKSNPSRRRRNHKQGSWKVTYRMRSFSARARGGKGRVESKTGLTEGDARSFYRSLRDPNRRQEGVSEPRIYQFLGGRWDEVFPRERNQGQRNRKGMESWAR